LGTIDMGAYESATAAASPLVLLTSLQSVPLCLGSTEDYTVQASGPESFAWQYLNNGVWTPFTLAGTTATGPALGAYQISSNATSSSLTVSGIVPGMNGYEFRFTIPGVYTSAPVS